jgi:preprotein translocase subunit YajC
MSFLLLAQQQDGQPQAPGGFMNGPLFLPFMIGLMVMFYLVVILPMSRRQTKEREQLIATLKRGTRVQTSGGVVGTVVSAKDGEDEIVIRSEDTKLRIKRAAVVQILGADEAEAAKS